MRTPKKTERLLLRALGRGFMGRCPACGGGQVLSGYILPAKNCTECGEPFVRYHTADFAPYLVTFLIGLVFTPLTIILAVRMPDNPFVIWLFLACAVVAALALLPRIKGAAIALLWALDVPNA